MSHLAQPHDAPADGRLALLQRRDHRARRSSCPGRQVGPSRAGAVAVTAGRGRVGGGRPAKVVGDDGDALAGTRPDEPRTAAAAAVGVEGSQVTGSGGERSER